MKSFSTIVVRSNFQSSTNTARTLVEQGEKTASKDVDLLDVSKETRGLAFVILFAGYESLLKGLSREMLEVASSFRGKIENLQPQFATAGLFECVQSIRDTEKSKLWHKTAPEILSKLSCKADCISTGFFPDDGSFMNQSQVRCFCNYYALPDPAKILKKTWSDIPTVRRARNSLSPGDETPSEVGRNYTYNEVLNIISDWEKHWLEFIDKVESIASQKAFYIK